MKREPTKGREYIGTDSESPDGFRGRMTEDDVRRSDLGDWVILRGDEGVVRSFYVRELSIPSERRVSKEQPEPPEGWAYSVLSHDLHEITRVDGKWARLFGSNEVVAHRLEPDELVAVARFLRKLARWHARRDAKAVKA